MVTLVDEDTPLPRGGRRRQESRRRLMEAARRLFVERGYHATRPQDIAREAEVGNGTFYLHFTDKRDIFLAFADEACAELEAVLEPPLTDMSRPLPLRLRDALIAAVEHGERNKGLMRTALMDLAIIDPGELPAEIPRDRLAAMIARALAPEIARGGMPEYDPVLLSHAVMGMVEQAASYCERRLVPTDVLVDTLTRFVLGAFAPRPIASDVS
jgi:AcrR family transcriptional regulator